MLTGTGAVSNDPTLAGTVQEVDDDPTKEGTDNGREEIKIKRNGKKENLALGKKGSKIYD